MTPISKHQILHIWKTGNSNFMIDWPLQFDKSLKDISSHQSSCGGGHFNSTKKAEGLAIKKVNDQKLFPGFRWWKVRAWLFQRKYCKKLVPPPQRGHQFQFYFHFNRKKMLFQLNFTWKENFLNKRLQEPAKAFTKRSISEIDAL